MTAGLPAGFTAGHWTDRSGWTGCTAVLAPEGCVAAGEVRGGGPGTRESDLLSPATAARGVQAVLLTGGSAYGLAAADGVVRHLAERGRGHPTRAGIVPLVPAAVIYDLPLGDREARPGPEAGYAACEAAAPQLERGSVGAGTGATVGKLLGSERWTKGGLGVAGESLGGATVCALAVANAFGDVLAEDGSVLAGIRREGRFVSTVELLREGVMPTLLSARESTTLVCLMTDARLTKTDAWIVARGATAGVARAVDPSATAVDGDLVYCLASGEVEVDPTPLAGIAAHAVSAAIRDAVREATSAPGCPAIRDLPG